VPHLTGTCCYALTRAAAAHFLARSAGQALVADDWDQLVAGAPVEVFYAPLLAHPEPEAAASHLERERRALEPSLARKLLGPRLPAHLRQRVADLAFAWTGPRRGWARLG
jgi:hypothetical protein